MHIIPELDAILASDQDEALKTLQDWIRIPSVRAGASAPNAPFGKDVRRMLDQAMLDIAKTGLVPRDVDGYACDTEIGQGEEVIGMLAHLDVVPEGTGWTQPPYGATIVDGRLYGRGTSDDKGPAVAALYAMRAVKEAGIPLKRRVRLILGCDEESGMDDIAYYDRKIGLPARGFSPDAEFPVINTEKGILQMEVSGALDSAAGTYVLLSVQSGTRPNVVPNTAVARLSGEYDKLLAAVTDACKKLCVAFELTREDDENLLTVRGTSAHASMPWDGVNAASALLRVLREIGVGGEKLSLLTDAIALAWDGSGLGIAGEDKVSGKLTCNLGLLSYDGAQLRATLDCRYPVFFDDQQITHFAAQNLAACGFSLMSGHASKPHHVPASSEIVTKLLDVYHEITGLDAHTLAIGGGTYARTMKEAVAFGALFPGEVELAHQADENIDIKRFYLTIRIFAYAIVALAA